MTQEVKVTLQLEVDCTQQKGDIEEFIKDLINTHTFHSNSYNRMVFPSIKIIEIQEEKELYSTESNPPVPSEPVCTIRATYIGKNLLLGYEKGKTYDLIVQDKTVRRVSDYSGYVAYTSLEAFFQNWSVLNV